MTAEHTISNGRSRFSSLIVALFLLVAGVAVYEVASRLIVGYLETKEEARRAEARLPINDALAATAAGFKKVVPGQTVVVGKIEWVDAVTTFGRTRRCITEFGGLIEVLSVHGPDIRVKYVGVRSEKSDRTWCPESEFTMKSEDFLAQNAIYLEVRKKCPHAKLDPDQTSQCRLGYRERPSA